MIQFTLMKPPGRQWEWDLLGTCSELASLMLSDEEAEEVKKKLAQGWRGPILPTWVEQLLQDREERRQRERAAGPPGHRTR